jgi:hypothetical protein
VTADVSSPTFAVAGPTQLPSASSEVAMTTTTAQATADLRALGTASALACVKTVVQALLTAQHLPAGTKVDIESVTPPRLADTGPGSGFRFSFSIPSFGALYDETFLYTAGRAELALSFTSVGKPFRPDWALSISKTIVARAETLLGS